MSRDNANELLLQAKQALVCRHLKIEEDRNPWVNLFQRDDYQEKFSELKKSGILPTSEELSHCAFRDSASAWNVFFEKDNTSEKIVFFAELVDAGLYPSATECNAECTNEHNLSKNVWSWLATACDDAQYAGKSKCKIFNELLNHGIKPNTAALAATRIGVAHDENTWLRLLKHDHVENRHSYCEIFNRLLNFGIIPSAKDLSLTDCSGHSVWTQLASYPSEEERFSIFLDMLGHHTPRQEILNSVTLTGENVWMLLARTIYLNARAGYACNIFHHLLSGGVVPTQKTLTTCLISSSRHAGKNAWWFLENTINFDSKRILKRLVEHGLLPSSLPALSQPSMQEKEVLRWRIAHPETDGVIHSLINLAYQKTFLPALCGIGLLYFAKKSFLPSEIRFNISEFLLSERELRHMMMVSHTTSDDGRLELNSSFLLSVWRFFFLTRLQEYVNKHTTYHYTDSNGAALLRNVTDQLNDNTEETPTVIFRALWLALHAEKQKENRNAEFSGILASGIRLFPRCYIDGRFKKNELPRITAVPSAPGIMMF